MEEDAYEVIRDAMKKRMCDDADQPVLHDLLPSAKGCFYQKATFPPLLFTESYRSIRSQQMVKD